MDEGQERYAFTWPGKADAIRQAQTPTTATLRPDEKSSANWDTTENLYIEGDNLEVLKLLQRGSHGTVKMIYIDPPYNTGKDFVYKDSFQDSIENYKKQARLNVQTNADTSGRYHSDWLSMMYPRLRLARELLTSDGAIFISIDDNEERNVKMLCDEVFGEQNFICRIIWKKRSTPPNDQVIGAAHEYVLIYAKDQAKLQLNLRARSENQLANYKNPDNHPKGPWASGDLSANVKGGRYVESLNFPIVNPNTGEEHWPPHNGNWRFNKDRVAELLSNSEIYFGVDGKGRPKLKRFLCDTKQGVTYTSIWDFVPLNTQGSTEMTQLLGNMAVFDNPKPTGLIKELLKLGSSADSLVLDFYSGSATTADALLQLNAENGENRHFILVQLPESTSSNSEAKRVGFDNVCEIGEERIRLVGEKVQNLIENGNRQLKLGENPKPIPDIGFRVLKLDSSNFDRAEGGTLVDNLVKPDRTNDDIIFEMMLKWGLELSLPVEKTEVAGYPITSIAADELICCMNEGLTVEVLEAIAALEPKRVFFLDSVLTDTIKLNAAQIFKRVGDKLGYEIELRTA